MKRRSPLCTSAFVWFVLSTSGCIYERFELGESDAKPSGGTAQSGGSANTDSTSAAGRSTGRIGTPSTGGTISTGGGISVGGTLSTGGRISTGGTSSTGGGISVGGTLATGGSVSNAGTAPTAGTVSQAGTAATAGSAGNMSTGGNVSTAGASSIVPPSCGTLTAECLGGSCCETINVAPGSYFRGRSQIPGVGDYYESTADWDIPEHIAQVTHAFALDKYEVTVGRFRAFVQEYDAWHVAGLNPKVGAGAHSALPGTGWKQIWSDDTIHVPANAAALVAQLRCDALSATWTNIAGTAADNLPINCLNWYVAASFCIWDGGRLPTETEWEYVAANGSNNQLYPWGTTAPSVLTANYADTDNSPFLPVGSKPAGAGALGHLDLMGSMNELVFDSLSMNDYQKYANTPCIDCYFTSENGLYGGTVPNNVSRGGAWDLPAFFVRSAYRGGGARLNPVPNTGVRCARTTVP